MISVATIDTCNRQPEHEPHMRMSMTWPDSRRPSEPLWCLGYYDQKRQCRRVVVQHGDRDNDPVLVGEGLTVVGSAYREPREPREVADGGCGECREPEDFDWDDFHEFVNDAPVITCHAHKTLAPGWTYSSDVEVGLAAWQNTPVMKVTT